MTNPGDWTEDFDHENGMYDCRCVGCGKEFTGHKRRYTCKMCYVKAKNARDKTLVLRLLELAGDYPRTLEFREAADRIEKLEKWNQDMVRMSASGGKLDGYRELALKCASLEAENEILCDRLEKNVIRIGQLRRQRNSLSRKLIELENDEVIRHGDDIDD